MKSVKVPPFSVVRTPSRSLRPTPSLRPGVPRGPFWAKIRRACWCAFVCRPIRGLVRIVLQVCGENGVLGGPLSLQKASEGLQPKVAEMGPKQAIRGPAHWPHAGKGCPNKPSALGLVPNRPEKAPAERCRDSTAKGASKGAVL